MIFADLFFLYIFIPAAAICYALARYLDLALFAPHKGGSHFSAPARRHPLENGVLVIFSLIFYAWGEPIYVLLMIASVLVNYFIGLGLAKGRSKAVLILGVVFNIAVIGVFKYADFLVETINLLGFGIPLPNIRLPIGISFFTFQTMSYLFDVYRGETAVQKSFVNLLLYISMFPQLIAGPIVRYDTIAEEIDSRSISFDDIAEGSFRFLIGLGKKVILANQLSGLSGQFLDGDITALSAGSAWLGIIAYTLQIYFDFSGYSDMAIGMGRCFGFHFDENFNYPYISSTITEFWRRWHISLGSFFRDYVYIPMGGNRRHQLLNIMTVWFLTGLWHGASWNFVLWGLWFFVFLMIERLFLKKILEKVPVLSNVYLLIVVIIGWVIFRFTNLDFGLALVRSMFGMNGNELLSFTSQTLLKNNMFLLAVSIFASLPLMKILRQKIEVSLVGTGFLQKAWNVAFYAVIPVVLLLLSTASLVGDSYNPFIYFQF